MKKSISLIIMLLLAFVASAQETVTLKFTSTTPDGSYFPFDAVNVINVTRNWTESLTYPDTTMVLTSYDSLQEESYHGGFLSEVFPNPSSGTGTVFFWMEKSGLLNTKILDIKGDILSEHAESIDEGAYQITINMSKRQTAFLVLTTNENQFIKKVINTGIGMNDNISISKVSSGKQNSESRDGGEFAIGDIMSYMAVSNIGNHTVESIRITQAQFNDETIVLTFPLTDPAVSTAEVTNISTNSAIAGGTVTSDGGGIISARGVCWSTSQNPTVSDSHTSNGTGIGSFTTSLTNLDRNTTYYIRAYATNEKSTSYGNELCFTTAVALPEITTTDVTDIAQTHATCGGEVTDDGGDTVTDRGICWGFEQAPTISGSHVSCGEGTGVFSVQLTNLGINTTYYVRSYAVNSAGTSYGNEVSFTTTAYLPFVNTSEVTDITQAHATCGGTVTYDGGAAVTDKGICWSTEHEPTTSDNHTSCGEGSGSFSGQLTRLNFNTTYYVRSYAVNIAGTSYGEEVSFTTPPMVENIRILAIGNSYSADMLGYFPYILHSIGVEANITIGILNLGGSTPVAHVTNFENQAQEYSYFMYEADSIWHWRGYQNIQYALHNYEWDIILLHQASASAPLWEYHQPYIGILIDYINDYLDYQVKFGWYMVQSKPATALYGSNYPEEVILERYDSIAVNAQRVLNETGCEFMIPVGTALQNARTIPAIKALGEYANMPANTSGCGYLDHDGIHLQEGLPCQIAAYTCVLSILEQFGALDAYSIEDDNIIVTPEWLDRKHVPGMNGDPVGSNDANRIIGQRCAREAFNNPYQVTDMNE